MCELLLKKRCENLRNKMLKKGITEEFDDNFKFNNSIDLKNILLSNYKDQNNIERK